MEMLGLMNCTQHNSFASERLSRYSQFPASAMGEEEIRPTEGHPEAGASRVKGFRPSFFSDAAAPQRRQLQGVECNHNLSSHLPYPKSGQVLLNRSAESTPWSPKLPSRQRGFPNRRVATDSRRRSRSSLVPGLQAQRKRLRRCAWGRIQEGNVGLRFVGAGADDGTCTSSMAFSGHLQFAVHDKALANMQKYETHDLASLHSHASPMGNCWFPRGGTVQLLHLSHCTRTVSQSRW